MTDSHFPTAKEEVIRSISTAPIEAGDITTKLPSATFVCLILLEAIVILQSITVTRINI